MHLLATNILKFISLPISCSFPACRLLCIGALGIPTVASHGRVASTAKSLPIKSLRARETELSDVDGPHPNLVTIHDDPLRALVLTVSVRAYSHHGKPYTCGTCGDLVGLCTSSFAAAVGRSTGATGVAGCNRIHRFVSVTFRYLLFLGRQCTAGQYGNLARRIASLACPRPPHARTAS